MFKYILKRLLLMIPTFLGATFMVFAILNFVPSGPLERAITQIEAANMSGGGEAGGGSATTSKDSVSPKVLDKLRRQYGLDQPFINRYLIWLGLYPRETKSKILEYNEPSREDLRFVETPEKTYAIQRWIKVTENSTIQMSGVGSDFKFSDEYDELPSASKINNWYDNSDWKIAETIDVLAIADTSAGIKKEINYSSEKQEQYFKLKTEITEKGKNTEESPNTYTEDWVRVQKQNDGEYNIQTGQLSYQKYSAKSGMKLIMPTPGGGTTKYTENSRRNSSFFAEKYINNWQTNTTNWSVAKNKEQVRIIRKAFSGIFTGDFGESTVYEKPVLTLIRERLHISVYFGLIGFIVTYLVCIPLGISKATRHNSKYDIATSALIFAGYATPNFALGVLLLVLFGGGSFLDVFPLGGFRSPNFDELSFFGKVWDQLHHTFLPVLCYMVGSFATLTILMKNSLMDNLGQDYVRTAFAKGLDERKVIYKHAVRNSLIPIATGLGGIIGLFLAGSYLIELVFNIDGIGLLSFKSIVNVDYPVFLGFLVINIIILLLGNLISDILYVIIDPRIKLD